MEKNLKCLGVFSHLVIVAALLLLTACGNDSPKMVITTQNGITTYGGKYEPERYIEAHIWSDELIEKYSLFVAEKFV